MPKKFQGENTKSSVARVRKAEKLVEEKELRDKAVEDAYWKDDDKLINKKFQRKEEKEKKRLEDAERRLQNKILEKQEADDLAPQIQPTKLTAYEIRQQKESNALANSNTNFKASHINEPLIENLNRLDDGDSITASGLDAAVAALSVDSSTTTDKHPERRMAAAFRAYESQRLPQLKKEFPSMRLSQLSQKLRKEWQKSPDNPLNKFVAS